MARRNILNDNFIFYTTERAVVNAIFILTLLKEPSPKNDLSFVSELDVEALVSQKKSFRGVQLNRCS